MAEEGYAAPDTVEAAVSILGGAQGDARVMAGGTDILVQLHADMIDPDLIIGK